MFGHRTGSVITMNSQPQNPAADNGASAWPRRASKVRRYGLGSPSIVDPTKYNRLVRVAGALLVAMVFISPLSPPQA